MEELLTVSYNFKLPIGVTIGGYLHIGVVEDMDDDRIRLDGEWFSMQDIEVIPS